MNMNKGIVMEVEASEIIVMTAEGRFTKIPLEQRTCQIGEEITFTELKPKRRKPWIMTGSFVAIAAAILLLLFNLNPGSTVMANKQIVAYVSIDINPSVEMGIDEHNIVLEIRGINADGVDLIKNMEYTGKNIDSLTEDLLQKAEEKYLSKGEGDIIISSTMGENGNVDSKVNDMDLSTKLKEVAVQHIEKAHPEQKANYQVTAFAADKEVRKAADSKGLSAGKYTIYLNAKDNGQDTTIDDLKKASVHSIAKKQGGIDKLIDSEGLSKEKTSKLLKEEENGDLDRKLNKWKNSLKNENTKNENTKNEATKNKNTKNEDKKNEAAKNDDKKNEAVKKNQGNEKSSDFFNRDSNRVKETVMPALTPKPIPEIESTAELKDKRNFNKWRDRASPSATPEANPIAQDDKKEKEIKNNSKDNRKQKDKSDE